MKALLAAIVLLIAAGLACYGSSLGNPSRKQIHELMVRVNEWQKGHPMVPADDRNWMRATWYTGVMAAWKSTRDRRFLNQAKAWGQQHGWQVGTETDGANRLFCSETWLELYFLEKRRGMIEPTIQWLNTKAPNSPAGATIWYLEEGRKYDDSLYGAAALAMLAKATGKTRYLEIMDSFFNDVTVELFDKESGLYYRDRRYIGKTTAQGHKILWSRGNGWAFAGIARVLEYLPENDPRRARYLEVFRRMASELMRRQGDDGFWRPNLDDAEDVKGPETSGTAFFCFGLAWGINHGVLDRGEFLSATTRAWAALDRSITPEGRVKWGQLVAHEPASVAEEDTHEYVTGTVLLAASEIYRLAGE